MSFLEGFLEFMTNSLPGAIGDTVIGRAHNGDRLESFENYVRPEGGTQNPNITINAGDLNINADAVHVTQSAPVEVPQQSLEEAAFNQALAQALLEEEQHQRQRL